MDQVRGLWARFRAWGRSPNGATNNHRLLVAALNVGLVGVVIVGARAYVTDHEQATTACQVRYEVLTQVKAALVDMMALVDDSAGVFVPDAIDILNQRLTPEPCSD